MGEIFERTVPETPLEWTGERLTSATAGQVEIEHLHRYFLARSLCRDRDVLDIACGEGYGSALMAQAARSVVGVDVSFEAVEHAKGAYARDNLRYEHGDARRIPVPDGSIDLLVSFETLEHFYEHDRFMEEARRVLRPGGLLLLSSPERDVYSPAGSQANPYHVNELSRVEFEQLLLRHFKHVRLLSQRPILGSALVVDDGVETLGTLTFEKRGPQHYEVSQGLPRPPYLLALVSDEQLPPAQHSLYIETDQIQRLVAMPAIEEAFAAQAAGVQTFEDERRRFMEQAETYEKNAQDAVAVRLSLEKRLVAAEEKAAYAAPAIELLRQLDEASARNAVVQSELDALRAQTVLLRQTLRTRVVDNGGGLVEARQQLAKAELEAREWRLRYEALRDRLSSLFRRFRLDLVAKITPRFAKRFVRERLLGGGRP